jgi:hypothetical protein
VFRELQSSLRGGLLWGVALSLVELGLLWLLAPRVSIVTPALAWLVLSLVALSCVPFWRWVPAGTQVHQLTERGIRTQRQLRIRWKNAVGWFPHPTNPNTFVVLGTGNVPVHFRFPLERERHALVTLLNARLPLVPLPEATRYIVIPRFSFSAALLMSLLSLLTAGLGLGLGPYIAYLTRTGWALLLLPALTALIPAYIAWRHFRAQYPQYPRLATAFAGGVWWFAAGLALPLLPAVVLRAFYPGVAA